MSKEVIIRLRDDLDQTLDDVQTIEFGWNGKVYEIDLSATNRTGFENVMETYLAVARPKKARKRGGQARKAQPAPPQEGTVRDQLAKRRQIREWANNNGFEVKGRGAIPQEVTEAWEAQNG